MKKIYVCAALATALLTFAAHAQEADLLLMKTGPDTAAAGTDVAYDIAVTNIGPDAALGVTIDDPIPAGMLFASETHDPAFTCTTPTVGSGGTVTCSTALLAAGATANFTFVFTIPPATAPGTLFLNIATVGSSTFDPNSENDMGIAGTSTPPPPEADMVITKNGPATAGPDTDVAYDITVTNAGPDAGENVSWADTLPGDMTFVSLTQDSGPAMNCSTPAVGAGGTITCTSASFPAGALAAFTLVGHIPSGTSSGTTYDNTATITADNDPTEENNSSSISTTVSATNTSTIKSGPPTGAAGDPIAYTISVANDGPDAAANVQLIDVLPPETTFVSLNQDSGPFASCNTPAPGGTGFVQCIFGALAPGASAVFTLTITPGNTTSVTNTSSVTSDSFDTNAADDESSVTTAVTPVADIAVTKSGPASVIAGSDISYTIIVTNDGPSDASNVSLTDVLPPNTTLVSFTQTSGPVFSCVGLVCGIATLPPGTSATFDLVVHVASSATGSIDNTATVTTTTSDPDTDDQQSTTTAAVTTSADLGVTKSGPASAFAASDITYTITVTNAGPSDAATVSLSDTLPAEATFVSLDQTSGPNFSCVIPAVGATGSITCDIATHVAGASATFQLVVNVPPALDAQITNTANVSSATSDPAAGNNAAAATTDVTPQPTDLSVAKTATGMFDTSAIVTYTIVVMNLGPGLASNVVVTDELPAGTTLVSSSTTQGTCSGMSTVTCNLGILAAGSDATITLEVQLPSTPGPISNTATVTLAEPDTNPDNNAGTAANAVVPPIPTLSPLVLALLGIALAIVALKILR